MARLSDFDLKNLLGDNYKVILNEDGTGGTAAEERAFLARKAEEAATNQRYNAIALCLLGGALVIAGFYLNGPIIGFEKGLGVVLLLIGLGWLFILRRGAARRSRI